MRKITAKRKGLLAVKMRGGWKPASETRPLFDEKIGIPLPLATAQMRKSMCEPCILASFRDLWYKRPMDYALKERIGKPNLFVGRKKELAFFLKWIDDIKEEKSQRKIPEYRHPGPPQNGENSPDGTVVQYHLLQKRRGDSFLL
jgi:hypothetical protein